jgi:L-ascorbate metabolism protein UlaG (beta-lactamase superfamily)
MGVFLHSTNAQGQSQKVLIDALHQKYRPTYLYPNTTLTQQMTQGTPPFDKVNLTLVTHIHADHFGASVCARQLSQNPHTRLVGSSQIRDSLQKNKLYPKIKNQVYVATKAEKITLNQIPLTILPIAHTWASRHSWVKNMGYIVELHGKKILHLGDADVSEEIFKPLALHKRKIDIAILPLWFANSRKAQQLVRKYINPAHVIVTHVPTGEKDQAFEQVVKHFATAMVFGISGEELTFL